MSYSSKWIIFFSRSQILHFLNKVCEKKGKMFFISHCVLSSRTPVNGMSTSIMVISAPLSTLNSPNFQQYLHCHPTLTNCSIPYSLATRGRLFCNHPDDLHTYASNLTRTFTSWVYPVPLIQNSYSVVSTTLTPMALLRLPPSVSHHYLPSWPSLSQTDPQGRFLYSLLGSINPVPSHPPLSPSKNPPTSTNSLLIRVSAPTGSQPCNRPDVKPVPFTILPTPSPAPVLTSLIPSLPLLTENP